MQLIAIFDSKFYVLAYIEIPTKTAKILKTEHMMNIKMMDVSRLVPLILKTFLSKRMNKNASKIFTQSSVTTKIICNTDIYLNNQHNLICSLFSA